MLWVSARVAVPLRVRGGGDDMGPEVLQRVRRRCAWRAVVAAGVAVAAIAAQEPGAVRAVEAGPDTARVYLTTGDGQQRLSDQGTVAFTAGGSSDLSIAVDPDRRYQEIEGFGASITDSSAAVLYRLDAAKREDVMRQLFDPTQGIGLSYLRQPIGASDYVDEPHYTYDDVPAGQTDFELQQFSIDHDRAQILPLLLRARAQPSAEGRRRAVEPAGVDEDERVPGRRALEGRRPRVRRLRPVPGQVPGGL